MMYVCMSLQLIILSTGLDTLKGDVGNAAPVMSSSSSSSSSPKHVEGGVSATVLRPGLNLTVEDLG